MTVELALLCFFAGTATGAGGVYLLVRSNLRGLNQARANYAAAAAEVSRQAREFGGGGQL